MAVGPRACRLKQSWSNASNVGKFWTPLNQVIHYNPGVRDAGKRPDSWKYVETTAVSRLSAISCHLGLCTGMKGGSEGGRLPSCHISLPRGLPEDIFFPRNSCNISIYLGFGRLYVLYKRFRSLVSPC